MQRCHTVSKYIIKYVAILNSSCVLVDRWLNFVCCKLKYTYVGMLVGNLLRRCKLLGGSLIIVISFVLIVGRQVFMFVRV